MTITAGQLDALMKQAEEVEAGHEIVREGQASQELILLLQGRVQVVRDGEVVSTLVEPGTFMGVLAFFTEGVRRATLRAESRTHLLRIPPSRIAPLIEATPSLGIRLLENVSQLFIETSRRSARLEVERGEHREAVVALMSVYFPVLALLAVEGGGHRVMATIIEAFGRRLDELGLLPTPLVVPRDPTPSELRQPDVEYALRHAKDRVRLHRSDPANGGSIDAVRRLAERLQLEY
jgi:CRP-like cAMP-binding protein